MLGGVALLRDGELWVGRAYAGKLTVEERRWIVLRLRLEDGELDGG